MATPEHCLYCFESLSAQLENRTGLSLPDVQKSYAAYLASQQEQQQQQQQPAPTKKLPALRRLAGPDAPSPNSSPSLGSGSSSSTSLLSDSTAATSISPSASPAPAGRAAKVTDPDAHYPLFVTWDKLHPPSGAWHLRGCIGTFSASEPLSSTLSEYALIAALRDSRFAPVSLREVASLRCAATLLTDFEECAGVDDWEVGEHGVRISFSWQGRRYGSTYLPSVAPEQGWDREQTMVSLMRKAGWEGRKATWREVAERSGIRVERYRGDKEEVEYAEYKAWRDWVEENWEQEEEDDE